MPLRRQPDQRKPHQRRRRQIEPLQAVCLTNLRSAAAAARPHPAPTDRSAATAPRPAAAPPAPAGPAAHGGSPHRRLACRPITACSEACSTPAQPRPQARAPAAPYRRPVPPHRTAHGTAVPPAAATAAGSPRSRRNRAPAARSRLASARPAQDRSGVRPPGARLLPHAAPAPSAPGTSVAARSRTAASPSSAGAKVQCADSAGPVGPIQRQRVDLDDMRKRHRRIAAGQLPVTGIRPAPIKRGRRPVRARAAGREPPQIVEAELRHRQRRQAPPPSRR